MFALRELRIRIHGLRKRLDGNIDQLASLLRTVLYYSATCLHTVVTVAAVSQNHVVAGFVKIRLIAT
jgi:hypothetical protein